MKRGVWGGATLISAATALVIACSDDASQVAPGNDRELDAGADALPSDDGDAEIGSVVIMPAGPVSAGRPFCVSMTAPAGATIHYTTDGSTPSEASPTYDGPFVFGATASTGVLAIAVSGTRRSAVTSAAYQYVPKGDDSPTSVQPPAGQYDAGVDVTLGYAGLGGITLCYTVDGGAPGCTAMPGGGEKVLACLEDGGVTATGGAPGTCIDAWTYDGGTIPLTGAPGTSTELKVMQCGYGRPNSDVTSAVFAF